MNNLHFVGDNFCRLIFLLSRLVFESRNFGAGFGALWQGYWGFFARHSRLDGEVQINFDSGSRTWALCIIRVGRQRRGGKSKRKPDALHSKEAGLRYVSLVDKIS